MPPRPIRFTHEERRSSLTIRGMLHAADGRRLCQVVDISATQLAESALGRDAEIARAERQIEQELVRLSQH